MIMFSFTSASMRDNLLAGKVLYIFYTKINIGKDELVSQTSMFGILLSSYYSLSHKLKPRDMSFEVSNINS